MIAPLTFSHRNAVTPRDDGQGMINTQFGLVREGTCGTPASVVGCLLPRQPQPQSTHGCTLDQDKMFMPVAETLTKRTPGEPADEEVLPFCQILDV